MASSTRKYKMTKAQKADFEELLKKYVPYSQEELDDIPLDGKYDRDRMSASHAKMFLENAEIID